MAEAAASPPDPLSVLRSRQFLVLLVLAAAVGVAASLVAWGFLQLVHYTQQWVFTDLPKELGYDTVPVWWSLPVLAIAGVVTALAIVRLPGTGGHVPANGLNPAPTLPIELPGVALAGFASIGLGTVVGPEAPLIAIGGALGLLTVDLLRSDAPDQVRVVISASATFAAVSFLFGSPIVAAILLIEATGLGGSRLPLVLVPGLLASGIGSLIWIGMGSVTGLNTSDISLGVLHVPAFARPDLADFGWTIVLAAAIALVTIAIFRLARETHHVAGRSPFLVLPIAGLVVAGLAIAFSQATDKGINEVLFSGQDAMAPLVADPGAWSLSVLALLIALKGLAYGLSLGSFRGGPTFPAMFLGAAAGLMAAKLPGFDLTPAVAVGIGAGVVSVLRLPLTAIVLAVLFIGSAAPGAGPLVIVGVIVAYLLTQALAPRPAPRAGGAGPSDTPSPAPEVAPGTAGPESTGAPITRSG